MGIIDQIREYMRSTGTSQTRLAPLLGIRQGRLSELLAGKRRPSRLLASDLAARLAGMRH